MSKPFVISWRKIYGLLALWVLAYIIVEYGMFWFPENGASYNNYYIDKETFIQSFLILVGARSVNVLVHVFVWDYIVLKRLHGLSPTLIIQMTSLVFYFIAVLIIVGLIFGKSVAGFVTTLGALGVVIGFGVQRLVLDAFSGLSINFDSPFSLGDFISFYQGRNEHHGRVTKMSWRLTTVTTNEGFEIAVPNSVLSGNPIVNFSRPIPTSEFELIYFFPTHYSNEYVEEILNNALKSIVEMKYILAKPGPKIRLTEFQLPNPMCPQMSMGYKVKYHMNPIHAGPGKVRHFVHTAVLKHLKAAGLSFIDDKPFHTHDDAFILGMLLERISFFHILSNKERDILQKSLVRHVVQRGEVIVEQNKKGDSLFILQKGHANVDILDEKAKKQRVSVLHPGDFFGEMSLFTGAPRSATITTGNEAVFYEVPKSAIAKILETNEELYVAFSKIIARRVEDSQNTLENIKNKGKKKKNLVDEYVTAIKNFFKKKPSEKKS